MRRGDKAGIEEGEATGDTFTSPYSYTLVTVGGTVVEFGQSTVRATRVPVEPIEAEGSPPAAVPTWIVSPPKAGTPAA